jgi:transketolase
MTEPARTRDAALEDRCVDTIRFLAVDAVQKANSGHPGTPMALAPAAHVLFTRHLRYDPGTPAWPDRDRFVLSAGHASMLLYGMLHLTGYDLSLDDLKAFRQWESRTPGHPEHGVVPGAETTTGPLGQGLSNAVGMAIAEAHLAAEFNDVEHQVVGHRTYVIAGDGDLMEGVASEAASLAGHLALGSLIVIYDDNHISIDGGTELSFTEDRVQRFEAYGWHVQRVADGNDREAIDAALLAAEAETARPSLIALRTHIGFGSPNKQDTAGAHGAPLGVDEVKLTKENLGWPLEPAFLVPEEVYAYYREAAGRAAAAHAEWRGREAAWRAADPGRARRWDDAWARALPEGWEAELPVYPADAKGVATRVASGEALAALVPAVPSLIGGSADLTPSNNTRVAGMVDFQPGSPEGRYLRFGVREHAMAAVANGLALHGGLRPYVATFFVFTDYLRPAMRLAALMEQPVVYVFTHDSVGLGEDGPTHQPVEHLAALRAIPGLIDLRPADANETMEAWRVALRSQDAPVALMLTRQRVPTIDRERHALATGVVRGGYVLADAPAAGGSGVPEIILIASGSEVQLALAAHERLVAEGVRSRVVDLASWALFSAQDAAYRDSVLPPGCRRRLAIEAASSFGWERWVGLDGDTLTLDRFGASAPGDVLFEEFGFTPDNVYARARALLAKGADVS